MKSWNHIDSSSSLRGSHRLRQRWTHRQLDNVDFEDPCQAWKRNPTGFQTCSKARSVVQVSGCSHHSFIHWFLPSIHRFIHSFIRLVTDALLIDLLTCWPSSFFIHWFIDLLIQWQIYWFTDSLGHRFVDSLIQWFTGSMIHLFVDSMFLFIDSLIRWFTDFTGSMIHWFVDSLRHWSFDSLIRCFIDSLIHRFILSLTQSVANGSFMSFHWHANNHLLIGWCTSQLQRLVASVSEILFYRVSSSYSVYLYVSKLRTTAGRALAGRES